MTQPICGEWLHRQPLPHAASRRRRRQPGSAHRRRSANVRQSTLSIGTRLLNACVTLVAFIAILWTLSDEAPLRLFGLGFTIPGYLVWAALIYAVVGSLLTHLIGWPLIPLNFQKQRFEADFRFNLVRTRENSEQIASLRGETAEREGHLDRFGHVFSQLDRDHAPAKTAHLLHARLYADRRDLSLSGGQPGLFLRRHAARRSDADRIGLQQRPDRALLFHQCLHQSQNTAQ